MTRLAQYVDRKIEDLRIASQLPVNMASVLTCLNVADELMKSQDENRLLRIRLEELQMKLKENA